MAFFVRVAGVVYFVTSVVDFRGALRFNLNSTMASLPYLYKTDEKSVRAQMCVLTPAAVWPVRCLGGVRTRQVVISLAAFDRQER